MSNYALVIDTNKQPLSPCHPSVARKLLDSGKAAVFRRYPFTIILNKSCSDIVNQAIELKIDPGSKTTGIALIQGEKIIFGGELSHRGNAIKASLESRRSLRRAGETHLNFIDKTPFLCINEGMGIYRLIDFFKVIVMV